MRQLPTMEHCPRISQSFTQIVIRVKIVFFSGSPIWGPVYKSAFENSKYAPLKISICSLNACLLSQKQKSMKKLGHEIGSKISNRDSKKEALREIFHQCNAMQHGVDVSLWVVL